MDCPFFVGQKVTPIENQGWQTRRASGAFERLNGPIYGEVYTVTGFSSPDEDENIGIILAEIKTHIVSSSGDERGWVHTCFRPVCKRKTDVGMAILKKIIKKKSKETV